MSHRPELSGNAVTTMLYLLLVHFIIEVLLRKSVLLQAAICIQQNSTYGKLQI